MLSYILLVSTLLCVNTIPIEDFAEEAFYYITEKHLECLEHKNSFQIQRYFVDLDHYNVKFCPVGYNRYGGVPYLTFIINFNRPQQHILSLLRGCGFLAFVKFLLIAPFEVSDQQISLELKLPLYDAKIYIIRPGDQAYLYIPPSEVYTIVDLIGSDICDSTTVACYPQSRLFFALKRAFNLSLASVASDIIFGYPANDVVEPNTWQVTSISRDSYLEGHREVGYYYASYLRDKENYYLLYCENGWRTHNEGFLHWTQPFSQLIWMVIGATILVTAVIGWLKEYRTKNSFASQILMIVAITLREPPSAPKEKFTILLVLVCFGFQFLSFRYESALTTQFTISAPPAIAPSLRHLIEKEGFKMIFPIHNRSMLSIYDFHEFELGFSNAGLNFSFEENVQVFDPPPHDTKPLTMANISNRLATDIPYTDRFVELLSVGLPSFMNGRFCHYLEKPFFQRIYSTRVTGKLHQRIIKYMGRTREVGIESFWIRSHKYLNNLRRSIILSSRPHANEMLAKYKRWNPFKPMALSWKFTQIFIISGVAIFISLVAFVFELVCITFRKPTGNLKGRIVSPKS